MYTVLFWIFFTINIGLVSDDVNENKEDLKKYEEVWEGVKKEIATINGGEILNMGNIFKKLGLSLMMICH